MGAKGGVMGDQPVAPTEAAAAAVDGHGPGMVKIAASGSRGDKIVLRAPRQDHTVGCGGLKSG